MLKPGPVELRSEHFLGECHADGHRKSLPERSGGRLDAEARLVLRMTGGS